MTLSGFSPSNGDKSNSGPSSMSMSRVIAREKTDLRHDVESLERRGMSVEQPYSAAATASGNADGSFVSGMRSRRGQALCPGMDEDLGTARVGGAPGVADARGAAATASTVMALRARARRPCRCRCASTAQRRARRHSARGMGP